MTKYFLKRLAIAIPTLIVVTLLTSGMLSLIPGDPSKVALGVQWTPEAGKEYLSSLGLDRSLPERYVSWASKAVRGDFGISYYDKGPVMDRIMRGFSLSLQLVLFALVLSLLIAVPIGIYAAYREGSRIDRFINTMSFGFLAVPGFVLAVLLLVIIGLRAKSGESYWFIVDYKSFFDNPLQCLRSLFLPALSIAIGQSASFIRIIRTDMSTTLKDDFVLMAKSKGLSDKYILLRHAFRPSSFTLMTVVGVAVGQLIGGLVIVESFFNLNGLGTEVFRSILQRDYATTLGAVTLVTLVFIVIATFVDMMYGVIDPRVRMARSLG
jgi:peptide/nickel transport system permease protein